MFGKDQSLTHKRTQLEHSGIRKIATELAARGHLTGSGKPHVASAWSVEPQVGRQGRTRRLRPYRASVLCVLCGALLSSPSSLQLGGCPEYRRGPALFALPSLCFTLVGTVVQAPNTRHEMILLPPRNSETADRVQPT